MVLNDQQSHQMPNKEQKLWKTSPENSNDPKFITKDWTI